MPYGSDFPKLTVGDIIEVHRLLLRQLGITRLAGVIGGSFGGMQVLEWVARYSEEIDRAMIIASAASLNSQALAFDIIGRHAITEDPNWNMGDYYGAEQHPHRGLSSARKIAHITYLSQELMDEKFGREKRAEWVTADEEQRQNREASFGTYFQVESYLQHQGEKFIRRFDANSYLHITLAMDEYDLRENYGSLEKAFEKVTSRLLVVSLSGDWLFTPCQSEELVTALVRQQKRVSYCHLDTDAGHDAFLTHISDLKRIINSFLATPEEMAQRATHQLSQSEHYQAVVDMIPRAGRVLDLGCGDGALLNILKARKQISGNGVEISVEGVITAIGAGCDVILEDVDDGLAMIPDDSYDQVVLSETLQTIKRPKELLQQILRVAQEAVITFPNFAGMEVRFQLLFGGRMPKGSDIPYEWYETPNIHLFTLKDFIALCQKEGIVIQELICQSNSWLGQLLLLLGFKNFAASKVVVRIKRQPASPSASSYAKATADKTPRQGSSWS
jgi:homoserine O-acetyltransferase